MSDTFAKPYESMDDSGTHPDRLQKLEFHLKSGDYFPLLSTIICFLEEGMRACASGDGPHSAPIKDEELKSIREDLIYLHKHYNIAPKS